MTLTHSIPLRLCAALALGAALSACNNPANDGVRGGPQAVHPSPSALAQSAAVTQVAVAPTPAAVSVAPAPVAAPPVYTPTANDGSQPIID